MGAGCRRALVVALIAALPTLVTPSFVPAAQAFAAIPDVTEVVQGSPDLFLDGTSAVSGAGITACYTVPSGVTQVDVQVLGQGGATGQLSSGGYPNHIAGNGGLGQLIHARVPVTPGTVLLAFVPKNHLGSVVYGEGSGEGGGMSYVANIEPGITCSPFNAGLGFDSWAGYDQHPTNPASFLVLAAGGGGGGGQGSDSSGGNGGNAGMPDGLGGQAGGANDRKDGSGGGGGTQSAGGFGGHSGCYFSTDLTTHCAYNGAAGGFFAGGAGGQLIFDGTNTSGGN